MSDKKSPKIKTIKKWRESFKWLKFIDGMKMVCTTCKAHEDKLRLMPGANLTFVTGSTNYCPSTLKDYKQTDGHKRAEKGAKHEKAKAMGSELPPRKVSQDPSPTDSTIAQGLCKMGENEHKVLVKFHHVAYQIALKDLPFTHFKDEIELQKLHNVKFKSGACKNESACHDFIVSISDFSWMKILKTFEKLIFLHYFVMVLHIIVSLNKKLYMLLTVIQKHLNHV